MVKLNLNLVRQDAEKAGDAVVLNRLYAESLVERLRSIGRTIREPAISIVLDEIIHELEIAKRGRR